MPPAAQPPPRSAPPRIGPLPLADGARMMPPLLPVLLPIVVAALVTGLLFAWFFPRATPGGSPPTVRFTDVTVAAGLGNAPPNLSAPDAPSTLGGGVVCLDYDGDGREDLLFVNGTNWPRAAASRRPARHGSLTLFHNDGNGHFTDVTMLAGLVIDLQGMTAAAGDYDNDGLPDIYVTAVGGNHLFHNLGRGRFKEVTDEAGVGGDRHLWSTGAAWIDLDGDGLLDLVVCNYARWPRDLDLAAALKPAGAGRPDGKVATLGGAFPSVYRNLGTGRFELLAGGAGLRDLDPQTGQPVPRALAVVPVDANGDGKLDLLFTHLTSDGTLFLNQGNGTFRRWTGNPDRRQEGAASALVVAAPLSLAEASATDVRFAALQAAMAPGKGPRPETYADLRTKLGVALLDYDLDGRIDFFSGSGRAELNTNRFERGRDFAAEPDLLWNNGDAWVAAPRSSTGSGHWWAQPLTARGVATADFDADGDLDVVMAQSGGAPRLLRNDQRLDMPWLQIDLVARRGVRSGDGARVEVHTPRRVLVQTMAPAMSLMAQSASTLTFGLGEDARVRKIVVRWADGNRQELQPDGVNRHLVIVEP